MIPIQTLLLNRLFILVAPYETPRVIGKICDSYSRVIGIQEIDPLILIPVVIHDFLCIHPFNDSNGRMSRLLTTLLLYHARYHVGKYLSLKSKISKHKELYYDVLKASQGSRWMRVFSSKYGKGWATFYTKA